MEFKISLEIRKACPCPEIPPFLFFKDMELTDAVNILCNLLEKRGNAEFKVTGFSLDWRLDIYTDLAIILPQIRDSVKALLAGESHTLEFYEQGVERTILFEVKNRVAICKDLTTEEVLGVDDFDPETLLDQYFDMHIQFKGWVEAEIPDASSSLAFQDWLTLQ